MPQIKIQLDKAPNEYYHSGDKVKCKILIHLIKHTKIQSISVQYKGKAKTTWPETVSKTEQKTFVGRAQYFCSYQFVFGAQNGVQQLIPPGYYPFESTYHLPATLPSSYKSAFGEVSYVVSVQIQTIDLENKQETRPFLVSCKVNLNDFFELRDSVQNITSQQYGCNFMCCKAGNIDMVTVIPCKGYIPGENIPIAIEIDNKSKVTIEHVTCELIEIIQYHVLEPYNDIKKEKRILWEHRFLGVARDENRYYQTTLFLNPDSKFKLLKGCGIIECKYFIKTTAILHRKKDLCNEIEITIGTVPFQKRLTQIQLLKQDVISPLRRVIPGSIFIANSSDRIKELNEREPLLLKK